MKRMISLLLSATLLLAVLPACQRPAVQSNPPERQPDAMEVVNMMLPVSGYDGQSIALEYLPDGENGVEFLTAYLENAYGLPEEVWEDAAIIRATGAFAFELAVLRLEDEGEAARVAGWLRSYISSRQGDFAGYAPKQADLVANGGVVQDGAYAALCICPDPDRAMAVFTAAVNGAVQAEPEQPDTLPPVTPRPDESGPVTLEPWAQGHDPDDSNRCQFIPPNKDDMSLYDTSAIRAAWETGDPSSLSGYDKDIYHAAKEVLGRVLKNGMSDLEKEIAVYHWVVNNVDYDWTHQDVMRETPRESFTPYGGLVNRTAVCLGYATTFQLLMDLAGVECITVAGAAFESQEDHGWNMVRLNGNWYCVDATWDANYREQRLTRGREKDWKFFNITSDDMVETNHQWDYANTPEAVTEENGRG